jgi:hypothetical protein
MVKKIVIIFIVLAAIATMVIIVKTINFGALTIKLIEQTAKVDISYERLKGNILRGFHIENYCVRISPDDSISGARADINYRLKPLGFRLPSIFEITLIEPTLALKHKKNKEKTTGLRLPALNVGLRLILKNGVLNYQTDKPYNFNGISGLVFIDLAGDQIYMNTVNLTFRSTEYRSKSASNKGFRLDVCRKRQLFLLR